jgi:cyclopropane-fatty-acyl-phospholipid synthase
VSELHGARLDPAGGDNRAGLDPAAGRGGARCTSRGDSVDKNQSREMHRPSDRFVTSPEHRRRGGAKSAYAPPTALERWALAQLLRLSGNPPVQFVFWNGAKWPASDSETVARLHIRNRRTLWQLLRDPDLRFGDAYTRGDLEIEGDLIECLVGLYHGARAAQQDNALRSGRQRRARRNTPAGSRSNIHHHYDLGNDFFRLWLDQEMVYTCAYFPTDTLSLEQAQHAKMEHVCRKLRLQQGETIIEAGCGWGSLARHMARHYGVRVRAYNISHSQITYARERAAAEGLDGQVEFVEDDYRNISGRCDAFVSVGMLEHVGPDNYPALGGVIERCLAPHGRGLLHSIGRDQPWPMNGWIERRIFPGAYPPTLREMMAVLEPAGFSVLDVENLRLHYAKTLEHWLARFEAHADQIQDRYDASFVRAWRLYLAGSLAAFLTGWLQLFQVVFTRSGENAIPWSRAHLYREGC